MKRKTPKRYIGKSRFIRELIMDFCRGKLVRVPEPTGAFGVTKIRYQVMTDEHGQKWDVPITEDLRKHDPEHWKHTFTIIRTDLVADE